MSDEIRALVDGRWAEYGIGSEPGTTNGTSGRHVRRSVAPIATSLTLAPKPD